MATSFQNMRILIVGGAGFVGSNLTLRLLRESPAEIIVVDNLLSSDAANVPAHPAVRFVYGSITDPEILYGLKDDIDFVFHLACYHGNQSSIANPLEDHANNAYPNLVLFNRLAGFANLKKVVYSAAGCAVAEKTFGEAHATSEDAPVSLFHDSPYSISKLIGELYGNYFFLHNRLPIVKARFQNVYGPREILGAGRWRGTVHTVWRNVTPTFIWKALHQEALPLDNGGNASRDFIFVEDIVEGLIACALRGTPGEAYNLASGVETSIRELAETINRLTGNTTPPDLRKPRDWDRSGKRFGSTEKSEREIGFKARVDLASGLERTIAWTKEHRELIERCMHQHDPFMR
ncbi:NAD-dependent epimerase/dehydratase family protein [uncultured Desulfovibrio sp.]|uniref:NAD-dependent epimerase/dehydratase family protein n=1 Tax=uncultured Desulfovibrio sp. TaxID=167968 RepID=UPI0026014F74|nr:NAD-dependent epimerase/dehydratase family protein [uncultured Desulfovibrio sp.]